MESNIKKYFTNIEEGCFITTTKDGDCYAITMLSQMHNLPKGKEMVGCQQNKV